jgi:hypothetical protein
MKCDLFQLLKILHTSLNPGEAGPYKQPLMPQLHKGQGPKDNNTLLQMIDPETNFVDQSKREATTANAD